MNSTRVRTVAVVGSAGSVGRMMVDRFESDGIAVLAIDAAPQDFSGSDHIVGDITAPDERLRSGLAGTDVLVLAIPEAAALAAVPLLARCLTPGTVLVDTLSVKSRFHEELRQCAPTRQAVGINPMFSPALDMRGRPVAAVVYWDGPGVAAFLEILEGWGPRVVLLESQQHDRIVAVTQALTHAAVLSFGLALSKLGVSTDELSSLAPPPHAVSLALLARVGLGSPHVYRDIQVGNPLAQHARAALEAGVLQLRDVVEHGTATDFADLQRCAVAPLGGLADFYSELCAEMFAGLGIRSGPAQRMDGWTDEDDG